MHLRVASMALGKSRVSADLLKVLDSDQPVQPVTDTLASELESGSVKTVLLYRSLASCLQAVLAESQGDIQQTAADVFQQWQDQASRLIQLVKRYRKQVLMFDEATVCQHPDGFVNRCTELWGLEINAQADLPAVQMPEQDSVVDLIATELFRRQPQAARLAGQLMALAQPIGDLDPPGFDLFELLADYQDSKTSVLKLDVQLAKSKRDNEAALKAKAHTDNVLQAKQAEYEQLQLVQSTTQDQLNALLEQLHTTQEALEAQMLAKLEMEKTAAVKFKALESSLDQAHKDAAAQRLTFEKRLSEAEKATLAALKSKADVDEALKLSETQLNQSKSDLSTAHKELSSLLEQLHSAKEALEAQRLANAEVEKAALIKCKAFEVSLDKLRKDSAAQLLELETRLSKSESETTSALNAKANVDKALQLSQMQLAQLKNDLATVQKESSSLLEQLHSAKKALEAQRQARMELEKLAGNKHKALEEALVALTDEYTQATLQWSSVDQENAKLVQQFLDLEKNQVAGLQAKAAVDKENTNLVKQLSDVKQQLESQAQQYLAHTNKRDAEVKKLEAELAKLEADLKKMEADLITARQTAKPLAKPVPVTDEQTTGVKTAQLEAEVKELNEENALLLEQLHFVQEEIERIYLGSKQQGLSDELIQSLLRSLRRVAYPDLNKQQQKQLIDQGFFDGGWYVRTYKDVANNVSAAQAPLNHFLRHGFFEGRNPCADKNTLAFIQQHPAVLATQEHPLLYWFLQSAAENNA